MGEFCPSMTTPPGLRLSDFDFALPRELIAQHPAAERSAARLLDGAPSPRATATSATCPTCCAPATCSSSTTPP